MSFDDYIIMEDYELVVNRWGFLKKIYKNGVGEWRVAPVVSQYGALNPNALQSCFFKAKQLWCLSLGRGKENA